jgi:uncharacterized membrane protein YkvA (DUF1232 family)
MPDLEKRFLSTIVLQLVQLPFDMKILFEAITDEELDHKARVLAAGGAIYVVGPFDAIPDSHPVLGFVDDTIVLRMVVAELRRIDSAGGARLIERFSEGFASLDQDLDTYRQYLGQAYPWLEAKALGMSQASYKGHSATEYVDDAEVQERLYDDSLAFATDYDVDDEKATRLKRPQTILEHLQRKMAEERR